MTREEKDKAVEVLVGIIHRTLRCTVAGATDDAGATIQVYPALGGPTWFMIHLKDEFLEHMGEKIFEGSQAADEGRVVYMARFANALMLLPALHATTDLVTNLRMKDKDDAERLEYKKKLVDAFKRICKDELTGLEMIEEGGPERQGE